MRAHRTPNNQDGQTHQASEKTALGQVLQLTTGNSTKTFHCDVNIFATEISRRRIFWNTIDRDASAIRIRRNALVT
jgi:hypothetical protein